MSIYDRMVSLLHDSSAHPLARLAAQEVIDMMLRHNLVNPEELV